METPCWCRIEGRKCGRRKPKEPPKDFKSMITEARNDIKVVNSYVIVIDDRQVNVDKRAISIDKDIVPLI